MGLASTGAVARLLAMDRTTLTANLKPLERRGLVTIERDPADRRNRLLAVTDRGRDVLPRAVPIREATHMAVEEALIAPDADTLRRGLAGLRA